MYLKKDQVVGLELVVCSDKGKDKASIPHNEDELDSSSEDEVTGDETIGYEREAPHNEANHGHRLNTIKKTH